LGVPQFTVIADMKKSLSEDQRALFVSFCALRYAVEHVDTSWEFFEKSKIKKNIFKSLYMIFNLLFVFILIWIWMEVKGNVILVVILFT